MGASGLIGLKVVEFLSADHHDVVAASRSSGVDVVSGAGLADALAGADALVAVPHSPSFEVDAPPWGSASTAPGSNGQSLARPYWGPLVVRATRSAQFREADAELT